ncbi:MAG: PQQ-dependent sugar dehydrogenase, partial [Chloroflexi bacterium]|nr:PQQ-dependent sugar dehydrogenase [Chloroflexota bacterium]
MAVLPVTSRRSYRPLAGTRLDLIVLGALLLLLCSSVACGLGSDGDSSTDPTVDASEPGTDLFPWLRGQRPERWGYNPLLATGLEDEPLREEPLPDGYRIERVVEGLDRPTHIAVLPDGRLLIAEQAGAIRIVEDGRLLAEPLHTVNAYLPEFEGVIELGLTGLAVDPEFDNHPYVYFYFTTREPHRSVLQRLAIAGDREGEVEELLSWFPAPPCCHVGGGMQFLPDATLLLGMGDHDEPLLAQNPNTPPGSILRLNR